MSNLRKFEIDEIVLEEIRPRYPHPTYPDDVSFPIDVARYILHDGEWHSRQELLANPHVTKNNLGSLLRKGEALSEQRETGNGLRKASWYRQTHRGYCAYLLHVCNVRDVVQWEREAAENILRDPKLVERVQTALKRVEDRRTLDAIERGPVPWEAWIVVMRGKQSLAKSTEQFYLTRAEAEKALANHPDAPYWEVNRVLVSWPD